MALPWGDGVFHSCELFSFQSGRKLFHIYSFSKMFWLPKFFFCNLRTDFILYSTCVVSLFPRRWKCQDTPPFIFHQNKSEQDLYLGWFSSLKVIEGPMDVTSWHHLRSEPSALSLVAGKFLSASSLGGAILTSPFWGCCLSVYMISLTTCSALCYSVKFRKTMVMYAWSAVFSCLGRHGCLWQGNGTKKPELWQ